MPHRLSHIIGQLGRTAGSVGRVGASLALVVLVAGACGDGSDESLSKQDYVAQANTICATTSEVIDPAFGEFFATLPDLDGPDAFVEAWDTLFDETVTPALEEQLAALRALAPPTGDADLLATLYDDLDQAIVDYNATLDQAVAGEPDAIESISSGEAESAADDVDRRAHDYGLTACGGQGE